MDRRILLRFAGTRHPHPAPRGGAQRQSPGTQVQSVLRARSHRRRAVPLRPRPGRPAGQAAKRSPPRPPPPRRGPFGVHRRRRLQRRGLRRAGQSRVDRLPGGGHRPRSAGRSRTGSRRAAAPDAGSATGAGYARGNGANPGRPPRSAALRQYQQRQNGSLSAGHRPNSGAGQVRHRAGAGDFAHPPDGAAVPGAVRRQFERPAQPAHRPGTLRRVEPHQFRAGPNRHRRPFRAVRPLPRPRTDRRGRGARRQLQAVRIPPLPRPGCRRHAGQTRTRLRHSRFRHPLGGIPLQREAGQIPALPHGFAGGGQAPADHPHRGPQA